MAPFPFLQRQNLPEHARLLRLVRYSPQLELENLVPGIDNLRRDVYLSPQFVQRTRRHIAALVAANGRVQDMVVEPMSLAAGGRALRPQPAAAPISPADF